MPLAGTLRQFDLADVLRVIESGQRTGVLVVTHADLQANVYFSAGQWVGVERVGATQVLAQQLVRSGLITVEDFEASFGVTFSQAGAISDAQLIRRLVGGSVISADQLRVFALQDASALLAVMLTWVEGEFAFEDGVGLPQGRVPIPLPVAQIVAQASQQARAAPTAGPARQMEQLPADVVLDFADVDPKSGSAIEVTRDQWRLLTAVDGRSPLWLIAEHLQAPLPLIQRLAGELVAARIAVVVGQVAAPAAYSY